MNFVVFRALGKNCQLISQKLHFPRSNGSLKKRFAVRNHKECTSHPVLTDRVHQPLATVRVALLYWMCGRVVYLRVAFLRHIARVCEECET